MTANPNPGPELLQRVKAGFILQGSTLKAWCKKSSVNPTAARHAIVGSWNGPKGQALRVRIVKAAKIERILQ